MRIALSCLLSLLPLQAQLPPQIFHSVALNLQNGQVLESTTAGYNNNTFRYFINGTVTLAPGDDPANFRLLVNGVNTAFANAGVPDVYSFGATLDMGPAAPAGGFPSSFPYAGDYVDADHIAKPVMAELINSSFVAVARARVTLIDKRRDPTIVTNAGSSPLTKSAAMEITQSGLDALESTHARTMPQPSLLEFNDSLTRRFRGYRESFSMNKSLGRSDRSCIPINDAPIVFRLTSQYGLFTASVQSNFAIYQAAQAQKSGVGSVASLLAGIPGANFLSFALVAGYQWYIDNQCVQANPLPSEYELCASSFSGATSALSIANINSVELGLGANGSIPPQMTLRNTLGRMDGLLDGYLENVTYRYKGNAGSSCAVRPEVRIDETVFAQNSALNAARQCTGLELDYTAPFNASATPHIIASDAGSTERNRITAGLAPSPNFVLTGTNSTTSNPPSSREKNPDKGICANNNFTPLVSTILNSFAEKERIALDNTWKASTPATQQANALDFLFSRWETGIYGDLNLSDHTLFQDYNALGSIGKNDRLLYALNTKAQRNGGGIPATGLQADPRILPCDNSASPCQNGRNFFGGQFDTSYTVTTGALNQVVRELSATDLIEFSYQPTFADLGLTPPVGGDPNSAATLNAATLSQISPSFGSIGAETLSIRVRTGGIRPFTYINPEPVQPPPPATIPEGRVNLTYMLPHLVMEFVTPGSGPTASPVVWLRLILDHYDPSFNLSMGNAPTENKLTPAWGGLENWKELVEFNRFLSCPMVSLAAPPPPPPGGLIGDFPPDCIANVARRFTNPLKTRLKTNLLYMLSRYPAPLLYNVDGLVPNQNSLRFRQREKFQDKQVITFYGDLQP